MEVLTGYLGELLEEEREGVDQGFLDHMNDNIHALIGSGSLLPLSSFLSTII